MFYSGALLKYSTLMHYLNSLDLYLSLHGEKISNSTKSVMVQKLFGKAFHSTEPKLSKLYLECSGLVNGTVKVFCIVSVVEYQSS